MKKIGMFLSAFAAALLLSACALSGGNTESPVGTQTEPGSSASVTADVTENTQFGSAIIETTEEAFEAAGFRLGDSCNLVFSNGYTVEDVPYYSGYFVRINDPVLVTSSDAGHLEATYNYAGFWKQASLREGDTVTISLSEAGKYLNVQEVLGNSYSCERSDYESDEAFCNFRAVSGGALKPDFIYRGTTPFDNSRGRASYTDPLLEAEGIRFILDLSDSDEEIREAAGQPDFHSPYAAELFAAGRVAALDMNMSFMSDDFRHSLADGLREMTAAEGPVYIHCTEGKDRTGFVCLLLEALAGADYDEMRADYMQSFTNYYSLTMEDTPEKYQEITDLNLNAFLSYLHNTEDESILKSADYTADAAAYLKGSGMNDEEIQALIDFITEYNRY